MRAAYWDLPPAEWTDEEAFHHLTKTFDKACLGWPDVMEPYVVQLAEIEPDGRKEMMRRGLRETIGQRYPGGN